MSLGYIIAQLALIGTRAAVQNYYDNNTPSRPERRKKPDTGMPLDGVCYEKEKSRAVILYGIKKVDDNLDLYKLRNHNTLVIPETVSLITEKLFSKISDIITIVCQSGSFAEEYAIFNGLKYTIDDDFYKDEKYHYQKKQKDQVTPVKSEEKYSAEKEYQIRSEKAEELKKEESLKKTEKAKKLSEFIEKKFVISGTGAWSDKAGKTETDNSFLAAEFRKYVKWLMKYTYEKSSGVSITTAVYTSFDPNNPFMVKYTGPSHKMESSDADEYDVIYDGKICRDMLYDSHLRKDALTEIVIKPGTKCIGYGALCDTNTVRKIILPDSISVIETGAFERSLWLSGIEMSKNIKKIEDAAFRFCPKLESIELPEGLQYIGRQAFRKCELLESVKIPDSVIFLGSYAFHKCINLKEVHLSKSLTVISEGMFMDCHQLKEAVIPEGIKVIEKRAFARCKNLERIILPPGLERIEKDVFLDCSRLRHIEIPESVNHIDSTVFGDRAPYVLITGKPFTYAHAYAECHEIAFLISYSTAAYRSNLSRVVKCKFMKDLYVSDVRTDLNYSVKMKKYANKYINSVKFNKEDPAALDIRYKIAVLKKRGVEIRMDNVISAERVKQYEAENNIVFPEDYVWFITNVGNGCRVSYPETNFLLSFPELHLNTPEHERNGKYYFSAATILHIDSKNKDVFKLYSNNGKSSDIYMNYLPDIKKTNTGIKTNFNSYTELFINMLYYYLNRTVGGLPYRNMDSFCRNGSAFRHKYFDSAGFWEDSKLCF